MRIIKPLKNLGILHKTWPEGSKNWLCVTALGFFNPRKPEQLLPETLQWGKIKETLGKGVVFDMAMPKIRGEVLVSGNACAPEGSHISEMEVGLEIGPIQKRLKIYGDRYWKRGFWPLHKITPPEKFSKLNLSYKNAYGGKGFNLNPEGKGYETFIQSLLYNGKKPIPMPNIERTYDLLTNLRQRPEVAGFGPLPLMSPQRMEMAGTYNKEWLDNLYPGYAKDMDWEIFNSAPVDQRINGFFNGTEAYTLIGMHPEYPVIKGNLPKVKPRSFIKFKDTENEGLTEISLRLDTVWFIPDKELGIIFYRGKIEVEDSDSLDVDTVMLAYENLEDKPRDVGYYNDVYKKRTNKKTVLAHMFHESQLAPVKNKEQLKKEAEEKQRAIDHELELKRETAIAHAKSHFLKSGLELPDNFQIPEPEPNPIGVVPPEALERLDIDLTEILENADKLVEKTKKEAEEKFEEAKKQKEEFLKNLEMKGLLSDDKEKIEKQKMKAVERAKDPGTTLLKETEQNKRNETGSNNPNIASGSDQELDKFLEELGLSSEKSQEKLPQGVTKEQLSQAVKSAQMVRRMAPEPAYPEETLFPEVANHLGEVIKGAIEKNESLTGRDFAGANLSGIDFSGLDLQGIMLEQANLSQARFAGCNLSEAVLTGADLTGTSFVDANLKKANLSKTRGKEAKFKNADLTESMLMHANLPESDFTAASLKKVNGIKASFIQSRWHKAVLEKCIFIESSFKDSDCTSIVIEKTIFIKPNINHANFRNARFKKVMLISADGDYADFTSSVLDKVYGGGMASFIGADFSYAKGPGCGWRSANMTDADFSYSQFDSSDFGEAILCKAIMNYGSFKNSIFIKANLEKAKMLNTNFLNALLKKSYVKDADMSGANLYGALMLETDFEDTKMDNVLLLRKPII